jgi:plasmid stability protein
MAQLLVRNIPDALARTLKERAAAHGISAEEEHRRILQEALAGNDRKENETRIGRLLAFSGTGDTGDDEDSLFDRNDPRHVRPDRKAQFDLED